MVVAVTAGTRGRTSNITLRDPVTRVEDHLPALLHPFPPLRVSHIAAAVVDDVKARLASTLAPPTALIRSEAV